MPFTCDVSWMRQVRVLGSGLRKHVSVPVCQDWQDVLETKVKQLSSLLGSQI
jgi:hypothetical protein